MGVAFITHPDCRLHEMGVGHPESPARLAAIDQALREVGLEPRLTRYQAPLATRAQLERVHAPAYVQTLFDSVPHSGYRYLDPDTAMNPHSLQAALRAAGAVVQAVDLVMGGEMGAAFCAVRPPGHHAERDRAMGFCLFNNVAVGAAHALSAHGLGRVAIVDFDVHHGNGTEHIFQDEARVLLCSSFQHPYYPHCGADTVSEHIVNMPLPAGADGAAFRAVFEATGLPAVDAFQPELIMVSAGFDAHAEDAMAGLVLREADYAWITGRIKTLADRHCQGRVVSVLEGGYALDALGRSVAAHLRGLVDAEAVSG